MHISPNEVGYSACALDNFGASNKSLADITVAAQSLGRPTWSAHETQWLGFDACWVCRVTVNQISCHIFTDCFAHTDQRLAIQTVTCVQENHKVARLEIVDCRNHSHTTKRPAALQKFDRIGHSTINKPLDVFRPRYDERFVCYY